MKRHRLANVALVAASSLLAVLLAELGVRLLPTFARYTEATPELYRAHATRGWMLHPNLDVDWRARRFARGGIRVTTDSLGNRAVPDPTKTATTTATILVLGDSFTFGWGVESEAAYPALLQARLNESLPGIRVEVVNSGVPGYGPRNEQATLADLIEHIEPSLVIVGFTENDFANVGADYDRYVVVDGKLRERRLVARSWVTRFNNWACSISALCRVAYGIKNQRTRSHQSQRSFGDMTIDVLRKSPPPEVTDAVHRTRDVFREMKGLLDGRDIPLVIASFPRSYQIYREEFVGRVQASGLDPVMFDVDQPARLIHTIAADLEVPHIDVGPSFKEQEISGAERNDLFLENDGHWNPKGHEIAAETIFRQGRELMREALRRTGRGSRLSSASRRPAVVK